MFLINFVLAHGSCLINAYLIDFISSTLIFKSLFISIIWIFEKSSLLRCLILTAITVPFLANMRFKERGRLARYLRNRIRLILWHFMISLIKLKWSLPAVAFWEIFFTNGSFPLQFFKHLIKKIFLNPFVYFWLCHSTIKKASSSYNHLLQIFLQFCLSGGKLSVIKDYCYLKCS